jgi:hypothetical protein
MDDAAARTLTGTTDAVNIIALVALAGAVLAVVGFAVLTVRDLRQSVSEIEGGMIHLTGDLTYPCRLSARRS